MRFLAAGAAAATACLLAASGAAFAQTFGVGNVVVSRVGDGSAALSSAATTVFLDEYTPGGTLVGSLALPAAASGANRQFTNSGSATSNLALTCSTNGQYLLLAGYDAAPGTAGVANSASAAINRVVARVDGNGAIDTSTALSDAFSGDNFRSAASADGNTLYLAGSSSGLPTTGGPRLTTLGGTSSTGLSDTINNIRLVNLFNNQLYFSTGSGTAARGIYAVGGGLPTAGGNTSTLLVDTGASSSPYDFVLTDPNTVYVADDRVVTTGATPTGGILKYVNSGGGFTLASTFGLANTTSTGFVGLRGLSRADNGLFYAISTDNRLVSFNETASTFATLATGATNTAFRGVDFAPTIAAIPEPGTATLALAALLPLAGALARRCRK